MLVRLTDTQGAVNQPPPPTLDTSNGPLIACSILHGMHINYINESLIDRIDATPGHPNQSQALNSHGQPTRQVPHFFYSATSESD